MKKQVTFAEKQTIHRLHHQNAVSRVLGMNQSETALKDVNFNSGLTTSRPPPQLLHLTTVQIPKTMTAAPFLKHTALTPAQKEFLYTIAASYSPEHVRSLITQHYMNVLHRCIRTGPDIRDSVVASPENKGEHRQPKTQSNVPSGSKHKEKISARTSFLPDIPHRQTRSVNTSASKHRNVKKKAKSRHTLRGKSPRRTRISHMEEEEEDEGLEDSLSECLSSLSVGEWDDDDFSDV